MKILKSLSGMFFTMAVMAMFGCGGGGGGAATPPPAPVAVADAITTAVAAAVTIPVLSNDTIVAPGVINIASVIISTQSLDGTAVANPGGTVTFTPAAGFIGTTTFAYTVANSSVPALTSNAAIVTVTVTATKAKLTLLSQGAAGTTIRGIEVTVELQSGVTVKSIPSTINPLLLETDAGVVVLSGATVADPATTKLLTTVYTPATPTAVGTVKILLSVQPDFNLGEYVTVNADIAAGTVPVATGFKLSGFTAADLNGVPITGVTSSFVPAFN